jgi:hypothetical protein
MNAGRRGERRATARGRAEANAPKGPSSSRPVTSRAATLPVVTNLATAHFDCVYPTCGGICCMNGRPAVEPHEVERIRANVDKFADHMLPAARELVARRGFLAKLEKEGRPTLATSKGWCVFFHEGCVLQKVGTAEGEPWKYKPWRCVLFPLTRDRKNGEWHVRQRGERGEAWDLFCLNPKESPKTADRTLANEVKELQRLVAEGRIPPRP